MAQRNCPEEERLSPIAVLLWIATRSQNFMRALEGLPHISLEAQLCQLQRENHSPYPMPLNFFPSLLFAPMAVTPARIHKNRSSKSQIASRGLVLPIPC